MSKTKIIRQGVEIIIPSDCELIERDYLYGLPLDVYVIIYWPISKIVEITYKSKNVWTRIEKDTYGNDGYVYDIKFNINN